MSAQCSSSVDDGDPITNHTCVCCLKQDTTFIRLTTCKHAGNFSKVFHYKALLPLRWICTDCHGLLRKTMAFKRQVERSIQWLNNTLHRSKDNVITPDRSFITSLKRTPTEISYTIDSNPLASYTVYSEPTHEPLFEDFTQPTNQQAAVTATEQPEGYNVLNMGSNCIVILPVAPINDPEQVEIKVEPDDFSDGEDDVPLSQIDVEPKVKKFKKTAADRLDTYAKRKKPADARDEASTSKQTRLEDKFGGKIRAVSLSKEEFMLERERERSKESYLKLPYKCQHCVVGFEHEVMLQEHMDKRHKEVIHLNEVPGPCGFVPKIENRSTEPLLDPLNTEIDIKQEVITEDVFIKMEPEANYDESSDNNDNSELKDNDMELNDNDNKLLIPKAVEFEEMKEQWVSRKKFTNKSQAVNYMKSQPTWTLQTDISDEKRRYYRCNRGDCKAGVLLLTISRKQQGRAYINVAEKHTCGIARDFVNRLYIEKKAKVTEDAKFKIRLTKNMRVYINDLIAQNLKYEQIMKCLLQKYDEYVTEAKQVKRFVEQSLKKYEIKKAQSQGRSRVSLSFPELYTWIKTHSKVPADLDEGFVCKQVINIEENTFKFIISTKRLLQNALEVQNLTLHTNLTYKFLWYEYPVILIGMTDREEIFHLLAIAICSDQKYEDFEFIFDSLKCIFIEEFHTDLTPKVLVTDSSEAIQSSFRKVFPRCPVRVCWNHMRATVAYDQKSFPYIEELLRDLDFVQASEDEESFTKCFGLFIQKWLPLHSNVVEYIKANWVAKNPGWYESYCPGTHSTNYSLYLASRDLKIEHNIPEKLHPKRYCSLIKNVVELRSSRYKHRRIKIAHSVSITSRLWKDAYEWSLLNKRIQLLRNNKFEKQYILPRGDLLDINLNTIKTKNLKTYDTYVQIKSSFCKLYIPNLEENWREGRCTCVVFIKTFICKHLLGFAVRLKYTTVPKDVVRNYHYQKTCKKMREGAKEPKVKEKKETEEKAKEAREEAKEAEVKEEKNTKEKPKEAEAKEAREEAKEAKVKEEKNTNEKPKEAEAKEAREEAKEAKVKEPEAEERTNSGSSVENDWSKIE